MTTVSFIIVFSILLLNKYTICTIDINVAELRYLSDHLTPEECRRLVAAVHIKAYEEPKDLAEAEMKISKVETCMELLLHWNSTPGEGKGESHEVLEHRLRQMGKYDLANWLGRTVFHEIGKDLNDAIESGLKDISNETNVETYTLKIITTENYEDPTKWLPLDSVLFALLVVLILALIGICIKLVYSITFKRFFNLFKRFRKKTSYQKLESIQETSESIQETSESDTEDKFDVRSTSPGLIRHLSTCKCEK